MNTIQLANMKIIQKMTDMPTKRAILYSIKEFHVSNIRIFLIFFSQGLVSAEQFYLASQFPE